MDLEEDLKVIMSVMSALVLFCKHVWKRNQPARPTVELDSILLFAAEVTEILSW